MDAPIRGRSRAPTTARVAMAQARRQRSPPSQQLKIGPATLFRKLKEYSDGHRSLLFLPELARRTLELAGAV